jgi:hypothetical protein
VTWRGEPVPWWCDDPCWRLVWVFADGRLVPARCGASNRCRHCSWLAALENAVVVSLDAAVELPRIGFTVTTRAAYTSPEKFRRDVEQLVKALRRRWPVARYLVQIEFTTGLGTRSGGHRRIHAHGLLKGVPVEDVGEVQAVALRVWRERTGAKRVEAHELHRPAGAMAYLVNHHHKTAQAPPKGWTGKRLRPSQGYFTQPLPELRQAARAQLVDKRMQAAVMRAIDFDHAWEEAGGDVAYELLDGAMAQARSSEPPTLTHAQRVPSDFGDDGLPSAWALELLGAAGKET